MKLVLDMERALAAYDRQREVCWRLRDDIEGDGASIARVLEKLAGAYSNLCDPEGREDIKVDNANYRKQIEEYKQELDDYVSEVKEWIKQLERETALKLAFEMVINNAQKEDEKGAA